MEDVLNYFSAQSFMAHGHCYLWRPDILWTNVGADGLIAGAYFSIPLSLVYFVRRRRDLSFNWIFWMFAAFILLCGMTHIFEIWTVWHPNYGTQGMLKALTGIVSVLTAVMLWRLMPKALALPSTAQLTAANCKFAKLTEDLERLVDERTLEMKLARDGAAESEAQFRDLANALPQLCWMAEKDGYIFWYNEGWYDYTGRTPAEMEGWGWKSVHHPDLVQGVIADFAAAVAKGVLYEGTFPLRSKDGEWRWFLTRARPIFNEKGQVHRWFGTNTDITEQKQASEEAIRLLKELESERSRTETIIRQMPAALMIAEAPSGKIVFANDKVATVWREAYFEAREIADYDVWKAFHPDGCPYQPTDWPLARAIASGEVITNEDTEVRFADGTRGVMRLNAAPVRDREGGIVAGVLISQDITDEILTQRALRESEAKFRTIAEAMPQMVWSTLPDGLHDYYNRRWYEFTGVPEGSTDGEAWNGMFHPSDQERAWTVWRHSLETGEPYEIEYRLRHRSGAYRWTLGRALPIRDERGQIVRWMGTCTDVDDQKRAADLLEEKVNERTAELQEANKELEAFSYSVSHDLRAPLRGISGFSDVLLRRFGPSLNAEAQGYLMRVKDAASRMGQLIDDMLTLSRLARREISRQPADLSAMAASVIAAHREREPERRVNVVIENDLRASADPILLRSVVENLLGNAWKFTAKSHDARIEVGTLINDTTAGRAEQVYFVRDNGAGFDMTFKSKLFGIFQRLHSNEEFEGTGIGLASVQRIIRRHNGRVWAEAEVDRGATFYFTLGDSI